MVSLILICWIVNYPADSAIQHLNNQGLVVIMHVSHTVGSQHLFGLPLRMNGLYETQFDREGLDLLSLIF